MTILSARETKVLLLLACYRYLSRDQIQRFVLEVGIGPTSRNTISWRILDSLIRRGLVERTVRLIGGPDGGSGRYGYFLTAAGYRLARSLNGALPARRPASGGTFLMRHGMVTADVALAVRRWPQSQPGDELLDWECDWQAALRLGNSPVVPDAHFVYATADYEIDVFLEVDLGTEGTRFFARKISRYLDLYRSGGWREYLPAWPLVLTVTPSETRSAALKRATEAVLSSQPDAAKIRGQTEFGFSSLSDLLGSRGPRDAIWRIAGRTGSRPLVAEAHRSGQVLD